MSYRVVIRLKNKECKGSNCWNPPDMKRCRIHLFLEIICQVNETRNELVWKHLTIPDSNQHLLLLSGWKIWLSFIRPKWTLNILISFSHHLLRNEFVLIQAEYLWGSPGWGPPAHREWRRGVSPETEPSRGWSWSSGCSRMAAPARWRSDRRKPGRAWPQWRRPAPSSTSSPSGAPWLRRRRWCPCWPPRWRSGRRWTVVAADSDRWPSGRSPWGSAWSPRWPGPGWISPCRAGSFWEAPSWSGLPLSGKKEHVWWINMEFWQPFMP